MILFINGPFGVGKTSVARVLVERLPNAMLYDPEAIGYVLRRTPGLIRKVDDYQDYALWRGLVVVVARVLRTAFAETLVIPMSVWRRGCLDSITAGLRRVDPDLKCFRLTASRDVLVSRISSDSEDPGAYGWRMSHVEVCLSAAEDPTLGVEIPTDDVAPAEVAGRILACIREPAG